MRNLFVIFTLFSLGFCVSITESYADTHTAASPSYADVSAAIAAADAGDTVNVPAGGGSATWTNTLYIYKAIRLMGPGKDDLTITKSGVAIYYNPVSSSTALRFEIDGFTFTGGIRLCDRNYDGSYSAKNQTAGTAKNSIVIGNSVIGGQIYSMGDFRGVVYNVNFTGSGVQFSIMGSNATTYNNFGGDVSYGTAGMLYFEDCTWSGGASQAIGTNNGSGARWAVRYCTATGNPDGGLPIFDTHGCQADGNPGGMLHAIYGNIFPLGAKVTRIGLNQRGGKTVMFNNRFTQPSGGEEIYQQQNADGDADKYCAGAGGQAVVGPNSSYFFNNWMNGSIDNCYISNNVYGDLAENVTFWNYNASCTSSSCSAGIGCGSTAPTGTCTTGVGYWVTSYSPCSTPPATMADMKTYTQSGRFYKCTATNTWTSYFTPYTYPHPLRGGGPSAPKSLSVGPSN